MKPKLLMIFLLLTLMCAYSSPLYASSADLEILNTYAKKYIYIDEYTNPTGERVIQYTGLNRFLAEITQKKPTLDDGTIAKFILQYIGQEESNFPREDLLNLLQYADITTSRWTSQDGLLQISKSYAAIQKESYTIYDIWANVVWLGDTPLGDETILLLESDGMFYSEREDEGHVVESFLCPNCAKINFTTYTVNQYNSSGDHAWFQYLHIPVLHYSETTQYCGTCNTKADDKSLTLFLKYSVVAQQSEELNLTVVYVKQLFGLGDIRLDFQKDSDIFFYGPFNIISVYADYEDEKKIVVLGLSYEILGGVTLLSVFIVIIWKKWRRVSKEP